MIIFRFFFVFFFFCVEKDLWADAEQSTELVMKISCVVQ